MKQRIALAVGAALSAATLAAVPTASAQGSVRGERSGRGRAGHGDERLPHERARPGHDRERPDLLLAVPPATASRSRRVPLIMHSHGWGGSRTKDPAAFGRFLRAGYGVLSFDQRGFGESGGHAYVENPAVEGHDVRRLVRLVSRLGWVKQDGRGDPRMGAIGGSYGGGYQFLAAFEELRTKGKPVLDALAPEITWFDLNQSLAPDGVVRAAWANVLAAASLQSDALPPKVYAALAEGSATGVLARRLGPRHGEHRRVLREERPAVARLPGPQARHPGPARPGHHGLALPAAAGPGQLEARAHQGGPAAQHLRRLQRRPRAPAVVPRGIDVTSDPCSRKLAGGTFERLSLRFFNEQLRNRDTGLRGYGRLHLATPDSTCTSVRTVAPNTASPSGPWPCPRPPAPPCPSRSRTGPIRIAGSSYLTGTLTALGANNRAFYGLAVGTSEVDAHLVQNNVLPLNELAPVPARSVGSVSRRWRSTYPRDSRCTSS